MKYHGCCTSLFLLLDFTFSTLSAVKSNGFFNFFKVKSNSKKKWSTTTVVLHFKKKLKYNTHWTSLFLVHLRYLNMCKNWIVFWYRKKSSFTAPLWQLSCVSLGVAPIANKQVVRRVKIMSLQSVMIHVTGNTLYILYIFVVSKQSNWSRE